MYKTYKYADWFFKTFLSFNVKLVFSLFLLVIRMHRNIRDIEYLHVNIHFTYNIVTFFNVELQKNFIHCIFIPCILFFSIAKMFSQIKRYQITFIVYILPHRWQVRIKSMLSISIKMTQINITNCIEIFWGIFDHLTLIKQYLHAVA